MSLESFKDRSPENVPGRFYVGYWCTDCDLCRETAPANFGRIYRTAEVGGYSYVIKQPETPEEEAACREAMEHCCVRAIFCDGDQFGGVAHPPMSSVESRDTRNPDPPRTKNDDDCGCRTKTGGPTTRI
ncbi:MAG: ferredoxin [Verrucomicrobiales bacterium]|nr:ferredoxin [Verrucomicrobiales bacterium]